MPNINFSIKPYLSFIYLIFFLSTIVLPLMSTYFLIKKNLVSSLEMSNKKERFLPLLITCLWMSYGYYKLSGILILAPILRSELLGAIIIVFIASIISFFWKISLHMLGIGGVIGVLFSLNVLFGGILQIIIISVLFAGVLGVARINEKAHNETQVYAGFLIGFFIEVSSVLVF